MSVFSMNRGFSCTYSGRDFKKFTRLRRRKSDDEIKCRLKLREVWRSFEVIVTAQTRIGLRGHQVLDICASSVSRLIRLKKDFPARFVTAGQVSEIV